MDLQVGWDADAMSSLSTDMQVTERRAYSILEWLGDVGGLLDALRYIGYYLITPITAFKMRVALLTQSFCIFEIQKTHQGLSVSEKSAKKRSSFPSPETQGSVMKYQKIKPISFLRYLTNCRKRAKYKKLLDTSQEQI